MLPNLFYKLKLINCMCSLLYNHMKAFMISSTMDLHYHISFHEKRSMWVMNLMFDWNIASSDYTPDSWYHHLFLSEMYLLIHWFIHLKDIHVLLSMSQLLPLGLEICEHKGDSLYNVHSKLYPYIVKPGTFCQRALQFLSFWDEREPWFMQEQEKETIVTGAFLPAGGVLVSKQKKQNPERSYGR